MKPLKYLPWFFAALPIVAIIWFLFPATPLDKAGAKAPELSANKPQSSGIRSSELAPDGSRIKPPTPEEIEARKRYAEAKKRLDESKKRSVETAKKLANLSTPEYRERAADGIMRGRDQGYRNLFASWNIDSKTVNEALAIIRERQLRLIEDRTAYYHNSGPEKARKEFEFNKEMENSLAQMQLINLLGKSRASELFAAEKRMREAELAEAAARAGIKLPERN